MDSTIRLGPTGNVSTGSVMDVNKKSLQEKLQDYDPQLYIKWNPKKNAGYGMWEIRRRPDKKTAVYQGQVNGHDLYTLEYKEWDVNVVRTVPSLNYGILTDLKKNDLWEDIGLAGDYEKRMQQWLKNMERGEDEYKSEQEQKSYDEAIYMMMQHKSDLKAIKEAIGRGDNPNNLAKFWK